MARDRRAYARQLLLNHVAVTATVATAKQNQLRGVPREPIYYPASASDVNELFQAAKAAPLILIFGGVSEDRTHE